jgi:hypothetical protein
MGTEARSVHGTGASIVWTTNAPGDASVELGTTAAYGSSTPVASAPATAHRVDLDGLAPFTLYHARARSRDASGNVATSADVTFTTLASPTAVFAIPTAPTLPAAGGTYMDPTFGTTILRVTDANDGPDNQTAYSYWPSFNVDSTRLLVQKPGSAGELYGFDPAGFKLLGKAPLYPTPPPGSNVPLAEDSIWSGLDPDAIFGHATDLKLWSYDVAKGAWTLIKDFSARFPGQYLWQMSRSLDDDVFGFTLRDATTSAVTGYLVWRRSTDMLLLNVATPDLDEIQVDKTGRWCVVKTGLQGAGLVSVEVADLATGARSDLTDGAPDFAPGHSDNGAGVCVGNDRWNNQVTSRALATPHAFSTVLPFGSDWSVAFHLSLLADDEGWATLSTYEDPVSTGLWHDEVFQVATDGSGKMRRLAHHRSVYGGVYENSPRANVSRDGRFVAYTSDWDGSGQRDVFVVATPP